MLKRIFLGLVALFFVLVGVSILTVGYFFTYPEKFFGVLHSVTDRVFEGQKYEHNEEFFLEGISTIELSSQEMNLSFEVYSGSSLKVVVLGKIPRFEQGPFVFQTLEKNKLHFDFRDAFASSWIQMNVNGKEISHGSDVQLEARVYVPEFFKGVLNVNTQSGNVRVRLPRNLFYEVDLRSASGRISNSLRQETGSGILKESVGHIKVQTETGSISVEPL